MKKSYDEQNKEIWAKEAKKKWTKEGALTETNTAQQETKFRNYTLLCDEIRDIIKQG